MVPTPDLEAMLPFYPKMLPMLVRGVSSITSSKAIRLMSAAHDVTWDCMFNLWGDAIDVYQYDGSLPYYRVYHVKMTIAELKAAHLPERPPKRAREESCKDIPSNKFLQKLQLK